MVVEERTIQRRIGRVSSNLSDHLRDFFKTSDRAVESSSQGVVYRIVKWVDGTIHLVASNVFSVKVKNLSDIGNTGSFGEGGPEAVGDVLDGIDSDSVNGVVGNDVLDPIVPVVDDSLGLGVEIGENDGIIT